MVDFRSNKDKKLAEHYDYMEKLAEQQTGKKINRNSFRQAVYNALEKQSGDGDAQS